MFPPRLNVHLFNKSINSFHFFGVIGFALGLILGLLLSAQLQLKASIVLLLGAIGAATFFGMAFLAKKITGGETIVYYHHEVTIILLCFVVLILLKEPVLPYLDITILGIGTFLAFGRIGCYSVGCCHGRPHKHGVKYGKEHVEAGFTWYYQDVKLLPVQLVESGYVALTVAACIILLVNKVSPGTVLLFYTVIYGLFRFILEFFRGDPERALWMGVSEAQWTTILLIVITFCISFFGWLPLYFWHWVVILVLIIISSLRIIHFHRNISQQLVNSRHIKELADGLAVLDDVVRNPGINTEQINIYNTSSGFALSRGQHENNGRYEYFYTVSYKKQLTIETLRRVALVLKLVNKHYSDFSIKEGQNNIYHILFRGNTAGAESKE